MPGALGLDVYGLLRLGGVRFLGREVYEVLLGEVLKMKSMDLRENNPMDGLINKN